MESVYDGLNWLELAAICDKRDLPTYSGGRKSSWQDLKQRLLDNDARKSRTWSVADINRVAELEEEVARLRAQVAELEADAAILACAELISWKLHFLAERIRPQPTGEEINAAIERAQRRATNTKRGV